MCAGKIENIVSVVINIDIGLNLRQQISETQRRQISCFAMKIKKHDNLSLFIMIVILSETFSLYFASNMETDPFTVTSLNFGPFTVKDMILQKTPFTHYKYLLQTPFYLKGPHIGRQMISCKKIF